MERIDTKRKPVTGKRQVFIDTRKRIDLLNPRTFNPEQMLKAYSGPSEMRERFINWDILKKVDEELAQTVLDKLEIWE